MTLTDKMQQRPALFLVHQHENILDKMRRERWPHVSRAEWLRIRAELIEELDGAPRALPEAC